jgi:hypothetical protein
MARQRLAFLCELYKRSEGDSRQGVPYEDLVVALSFDERSTKRLQCALEQDGLVELTTLSPITHVGRTIIDPRHRRSGRQTIRMTTYGVGLIEELLANGACREAYSVGHQYANE